MAEYTEKECMQETIRAQDEWIKRLHSEWEQTLRENASLRAQVESLSVIRCPDGKMHQWDGDGQCRNCCNYATDLIDKALREGA